MLWCMRRTNLYLDEGQTAALDELARSQGMSRAAVVRQLINRQIHAGGADLDADLSAIEDSFGALRDGEFPQRGADERARHLDLIRSL